MQQSLHMLELYHVVTIERLFSGHKSVYHECYLSKSSFMRSIASIKGLNKVEDESYSDLREVPSLY
jgi:hypothetical protein